MKLSVVCSERRVDMLPPLRSILDNLFVESLAWFPRTDISIEQSLDELERCLNYSTYVLCIPAPDDYESSWLHYTLGHQRGRTDRLSFWMPPDESKAAPEWARRFVLINGDEKDVHDYYAEVEITWSEETKAHLAKKAISAKSIEVSPRAFIESVQNGDRFLMGLYLEAGFSPSLSDAAGVPVLNHALRAGHSELVLPLLEAGADLNGVACDRETTPVMEAAAGGLDEMTNKLIELGADLENTSRDGQTAVILAVGNARDVCAIALIKGGADVDKKDLLGMSARKYATLYNQASILTAISAAE